MVKFNLWRGNIEKGYYYVLPSPNTNQDCLFAWFDGEKMCAVDTDAEWTIEDDIYIHSVEESTLTYRNSEHEQRAKAEISKAVIQNKIQANLK